MRSFAFGGGGEEEGDYDGPSSIDHQSPSAAAAGKIQEDAGIRQPRKSTNKVRRIGWGSVELLLLMFRVGCSQLIDRFGI